MVTNVGKWDAWFASVTEPEPFGKSVTYELGAAWLAGCSVVADWGCGKGWLRNHIDPYRYRGIDGSRSPFTDEIVDLADYRSEVPGIFMRHVLEHDYRWKQILDNAVASFTERMVLIVFTPMSEWTHELIFASDPGVPDISFAVGDLTERFGDAIWTMEQLETPTQYGVETVFYLEKP